MEETEKTVTIPTIDFTEQADSVFDFKAHFWSLMVPARFCYRCNHPSDESRIAGQGPNKLWWPA